MRSKKLILLLTVFFLALTLPVFSEESMDKTVSKEKMGTGKMEKEEMETEKMEKEKMESEIPELEVAELEFCEAVENRMPVEAKEEFDSKVEKVYCWTKIKGGSHKNPTVIKHQYFYKDEMMAEIELNIGGSPWRTWSYKTIWHTWTGEWTLKIVDEAGKILKIAYFTVNKAEEKEEPKEMKETETPKKKMMKEDEEMHKMEEKKEEGM